jgi:SPP1 gp7 family putative phage head morphogenesis protein
MKTMNRSIERSPYGKIPKAQVGITGSPSILTVAALSTDASSKQSRPKTGRAERQFNSYLRRVAEHVGHMINGFEAGNIELLPTLTQLLRAYADALTPWAVSTSKRMLEEVNSRDKDSWRSLGTKISRQLRHDLMETNVGTVLRQLMGEQVTLIKSLPIEAAQRVHDLTIKGLEDSRRAKEFADMIRASGEVTASRATLIARTEVARTASILAQTRATGAGLTHYRWQTSEDADVRKGHQAMQGKICSYANPPAVNENGRIMRHHPGQIWNCRCWAEPIVEFE